jgi:hypothetical protein
MRFLNRKLQIGFAAIVLFSAVTVLYFSKPWFNETPGETKADHPQPNAAQSGDLHGTGGGRSGKSNEDKLPLENADVVIIGSELEGLYLARAAADEGLSVKILDPHTAFGGQVLQGEMLFLDETRDEHGKSLVQGRVKELFDGFKTGKIRKLPEFEKVFDQLTKGIPVETGIHIEEIGTTKAANGEKEITTVTYSTEDHQLKKISSSYWVDNSDFAALASRLQVTRLPGLEKFYGQQQIEYMSAGVMMKFKNVDWRAWMNAFNAMKPEERKKKFGGYAYLNDSFAIGFDGVTKAYKPTNDRVFLRGLNAVNQRDGEVLINALLVYNVNPADDKSVAEALELGNKETPLILEHFRKTLPGWEHAQVNGYPSYPYIREYNHYETDYVLQVSDLLSGRMFWDNVSIGGYPLDLQGISANKWGIEMGKPDKYGMPLRSFILKGYDNVIMAGKNVGASALAYGSARIQPNTSTAAESIGVILGQIHGKQKLSELKESDMKALQQYIATRYHIILTGVTGTNKLLGWTPEEIRKLDAGEIIFTTYKHSRAKK